MFLCINMIIVAVLVSVADATSIVNAGVGTLTLAEHYNHWGLAISNSHTPSRPSLSKTNLQIWPLGDSITYGSFGSNGGYRGFLYNLLTADTTSFLFVGSSTLNAAITVLPSAQRHNEGHAAYDIANVYTNLDGIDNSVFLRFHFPPTAGYWLTGIASGTNARPALFPDITLLLIGANERGNPKGAQGRLDNLVSKLVRMRPNSHLIIARITPITSCSGFVKAINQGIDVVVAKYAVNNMVTEVDLNAGFPTNGLSRDNLHPNDIGYRWMARKWYNAIHAVMSAAQ
jgi:hypothetical protein